MAGSDGCTGSQIWDEESQQCVVPPNDGGFDVDPPSGEFEQGGCPEGQLYVPADQSGSGVAECTDGFSVPSTESNVSDWQFGGLGLEDIENTPTTWEYADGHWMLTGSSWNVTDEFLAEGGIHTLGSEGILEWLAQEGFGEDVTQEQYDYMQTFGDIGEALAFDQSQIDELGIGFAMQEDAMYSEFQEWESGAEDMLWASTENFNTLAQQQLDAFELANTERRSQEKKNTADLRRSALQGLATTRRSSARSGISSGMGSTNALDSFMSQSREQALGSRAAQEDYLTSVTSTESQLAFNTEQAQTAYNNESVAKTLANENAMTQMNYDFAAQASSAYDDWYTSLVGMAGAYFQTARSGEEDFDLFGTGG